MLLVPGPELTDELGPEHPRAIEKISKTVIKADSFRIVYPTHHVFPKPKVRLSRCPTGPCLDAEASDMSWASSG